MELNDNKSYFIHRTGITSLFINYDHKTNGLPILLDRNTNFSIDGYYNIFELPFSLWEENDEQSLRYRQYLIENGITKEIYEKMMSENINRQLNSFFENGIYSRTNDIARTATNVNKNALDKLLNEDGFSFNSGNNLLGKISNRDRLNLLLVLEIPNECLSLNNTEKLFELSSETFEIDTTYHGRKGFNIVIPKQFIKGAFIKDGTNIKEVLNKYYDGDYKVKDGLYDDLIIERAINNFEGSSYSYDRALEIVNMVDNNYEKDDEISLYDYRIFRILDIIDNYFESNILGEVDDRNIDLYNRVFQKILKEKERHKTNFQKLFNYIEKNDFNSLSEEEIINIIYNFIDLGIDGLDKNSEYNTSDIYKYKSGINYLINKALPKLINSPDRDLVVENLGYRKIVMDEFDKEKSENEKLISIFTDPSSVDDKALRRKSINEKRTLFINSAMKEKSIKIVKEILSMLESLDFANISMDDCYKVLDALYDANTKTR